MYFRDGRYKIVATASTSAMGEAEWAKPGDTIEITRADSPYDGNRYVVVEPTHNRVEPGAAWVQRPERLTPTWWSPGSYKVVKRAGRSGKPTLAEDESVEASLKKRRDDVFRNMFRS
jgi:hypothetical protein